MNKNISATEALRAVLAAARPTGTETVALEEARGRTLAQPLASREDLPPFDNSAMDGFAVRTADVTGGAALNVAFEVPAGAAPTQSVAQGTCAQIMTGAPVPEGADAVAPVEWTERLGDGRVRFDRAPEKGANIRRAGEDVRAGTLLIESGAVVTPPVVGMAATLGDATVTVRRRPRVAVVATGDELVPAAETPGPGQIRNANGPALAAQAASAGAQPLPPRTAGDERAAVRRAFEDALKADVLLISGGMSMGEYDFVRDVLEEMGMAWHFWKVRQRPGKPFGFGALEGTLVFGLPGNPVSAAVCFEVYARPALAKMLGRQPAERPRHAARLTEALRTQAGMHTFARGVAAFDEEGRLRVRSAGAQGSHVYSSMTRANCLIHLPEELEHAPAGARVEVEWLDW